MFTNPLRNLLQFGDITGYHVADLGSGSGFYTLESAHRVGNNGKVYSIDIQKGLLERTRHEAQARRLKNIEYIWGDIEKPAGTKIADDTIHLAIVSNVFFQLEHKDTFIKELSRIIKPGGHVLLIDWTDSFGNLGPHKNHIVDEANTRLMFNKKGFKLKERIDAGEHHYGIIFVHEK
jgi:ubiquinone/menaquinone biosynthesis C-methylase UbiE